MARSILTVQAVARLFFLLCLLAGANAISIAQAYTPPPPPLTTLPPCPVPKDAKEARKIAKRRDCDATNRPLPVSVPKPEPASPASGPASASASAPAAKQFPFPGDKGDEAPVPAVNAVDTSTSASKAFPYPGSAPAPATDPPAAKPSPSASERDGEYVADPNVPHDPVAEKKAADTSAGKAFPYPGSHEGSPAPAAGAAPASDSSAPAPHPTPASSSSSSSSSSSDDDDDSQPRLADKGSEGKRNSKTSKPQTDAERVDEDLSVAKYYGQSGNAMGAYLRAKDAAKTEPDLPEARYVLGEAAKRLRKTDEAKAEFSEYLKLAPDGEHAKAAARALEELQ